MRTLVTYRSVYGHARSYAQWIAEDLGADLVDLTEDPEPSLSGYDAAVLVVSIYASGLPGAKQFAAQAEAASGVTLVGVTVGASNPENPDNVEALRAMVAKAIPASLQPRMTWFHLRGGLDYPRMSRLHRMMMWMVTQQAKRAAKKGDTEAAEMVATYGSVVDFRDRDTITPIVEHLKGSTPNP